MNKSRIIELPKLEDRRGNLTVIESFNHIPFDIARSYWIYDIPGGQSRGSHAFKTQEEVIVALSGSFDIVLDDGTERQTYTLNRSYQALYIPSRVWRKLENFSTNTVCLVLASKTFSEEDYIRNYKDFRQYIKTDDKIDGSFNEKFSTEDSSNQYNTIFDCSLIEFPVVRNRAGNIAFVENFIHIPFHIRRTFYIYDIPNGQSRGMHAHRQCHEILIAASGSFEVELDDGANKKTVLLNNPMCGLHIPPGVWATEKNYSSGAVCLAFASDRYDDDDYIKKYSDFKKYRQNASRNL